jgi:hypothetical protein
MLEVMALVPFGGVTGFGLNPQLAPVGNPVQLSVVAWLYPLTGVTVTVIAFDGCPATTVALAGFDPIVKSGATTVTTAADEVDDLCDASPRKVAVTLLVPPGSVVVLSTAVFVAVAG